jgi:hypothetical protein
MSWREARSFYCGPYWDTLTYIPIITSGIQTETHKAKTAEYA